MRTNDIFGLFGRPSFGLGQSVNPAFDQAAHDQAITDLCALTSEYKSQVIGGNQAAANNTRGKFEGIFRGASVSSSAVNLRNVYEDIRERCPNLAGWAWQLASPIIAVAQRAELIHPAAFIEPAKTTPGTTATPGTTSKPAPPEPGSPASFMRPWVQTTTAKAIPSATESGNLIPAPVATGGAHGYEEEASDYFQRLKEYQRVATESARRTAAEIDASNKATEEALKKLKAQYEPVATVANQPTENQYAWNRGTAECSPPMVPAPGGGCMPGVATGGGRGGLFNQAMNLGPSGGATAFTMGRRFPVVNL